MACPVCRSRNYAIAEVNSPNYSNLYIQGLGSIRLMVCMDCGVTYLSQKNRDLYKKYKEKTNA